MPGKEIKGTSKIANYRNGGRSAKISKRGPVYNKKTGRKIIRAATGEKLNNGNTNSQSNRRNNTQQ